MYKDMVMIAFYVHKVNIKPLQYEAVFSFFISFYSESSEQYFHESYQGYTRNLYYYLDSTHENNPEDILEFYSKNILALHPFYHLFDAKSLRRLFQYEPSQKNTNRNHYRHIFVTNPFFPLRS